MTEIQFIFIKEKCLFRHDELIGHIRTIVEEMFSYRAENVKLYSSSIHTYLYRKWGDGSLDIYDMPLPW